jgi:hypothetical protein
MLQTNDVTHGLGSKWDSCLQAVGVVLSKLLQTLEWQVASKATMMLIVFMMTGQCLLSARQ